MREAANDTLIRHIGVNDYAAICLYCGESVAPECGQLFADEQRGFAFVVHDEDCEPRQEIRERRGGDVKKRDRNALLGLLPIVAVLIVVIAVLAP